MATSFLTTALFGNAATRACFDDSALLRALLDVEAGLARAQASLNLIPESAATEIAALVARPDIALEALSAGVAQAGVPVPALVQILREKLSAEAADWVHFGATSQDIVDCAICLCAKNALNLQEKSLSSVIDALESLSKEHTHSPMLARTRGQLATPITFGLRVAQWARPLIGLEREISELREAALVVQFGGASGSRAALTGQGRAVGKSLAEALGLRDAPPWHTDRTGLRKLAQWQVRLVQALAKIGRDVALSARGEIAELEPGETGGSSTMPHKANPVRAEALESLAVMALAYDTGLNASAVHAEERDGALWPVEWALLPALFECSGAALSHASSLIGQIFVNTNAMAERLEATPQAFSEAAVFALAPTRGRVQAVRDVKDALTQGEDLGTLLKRHLGTETAQVLSAEAQSEPAAEVARDIFASRRVNSPEG